MNAILIKTEKAVRNVIRVGIAIGVLVNAIWLPLVRSEPLEPMGFAAMITACASAFAVREWGKIRGADSDSI